MRYTLLNCLLLISSAAAAQPVERIDVTLANFKFAPATIHLHHGRHYQLRLSNSGSGGHNFVAPEFFAATQVAGGAVKDGTVDVAGYESATVDLIAPPAGRYPVHCSHFMHSAFGMKGEILVD